MTVIVLERVPVSLRGELTRWMLELKAGIFVGKVTAMVRDRLWERVCTNMKGGAGMLIYSSDAEQSFTMRFWGAPDRTIVDFDGLSLIQIQH